MHFAAESHVDNSIEDPLIFAKTNVIELKNNKIINEPSHLVKEGEIFEVSLIYNRPKKYDPEELKLEIIYEDEDLLVINKQTGMVTHPAPGNETGTLVNALLFYTKNKIKRLLNDLGLDNYEIVNNGREYYVKIILNNNIYIIYIYIK